MTMLQINGKRVFSFKELMIHLQDRLKDYWPIDDFRAKRLRTVDVYLGSERTGYDQGFIGSYRSFESIQLERDLCLLHPGSAVKVKIYSNTYNTVWKITGITTAVCLTLVFKN